MSSTVLAVIGVVWFLGGILGAISYRRMGDAEKPELQFPFPFFDQLYNKRVHAVATAFFLVGGVVLLLIAVIS